MHHQQVHTVLVHRHDPSPSHLHLAALLRLAYECLPAKAMAEASVAVVGKVVVANPQDACPVENAAEEPHHRNVVVDRRYLVQQRVVLAVGLCRVGHRHSKQCALRACPETNSLDLCDTKLEPNACGPFRATLTSSHHAASTW